MLLEQYEENDLLFNINFKEKASQEGIIGYRGELILQPGEIADEKGRVKPPLAVVRSVVLLEKNEKIAFFVGILDDLALITTFFDKYSEDFSSDIRILMYAVNIISPMITDIRDVSVMLIPLRAGVAWNELVDELAMEKSDFKGQSPADKIVTAYEEFKSHKPKYESLPEEEALKRTADIKRELIGAV